MRKNFSPILFLIQKLDPKIQAWMQNIRAKSLVIKSEGFIGLQEGENVEKGGGELY